ncbi:MAG: STAS domain-containing protein [Rhodocyclaceae bacterium]|nr:STAS domain-containing protein [Rhodocyclaceae bacterium]MBX3668622.1 STAS domain-containing protein [Rhodocyclaceae bacterium]
MTSYCRIAFTNPLTSAHAVEQKFQILNAVAEYDHVELDISGSADMDGSGLQLLVMFRSALLHAGKCGAITHPRPAVREAVEFLRMGELFAAVAPEAQHGVA